MISTQYNVLFRVSGPRHDFIDQYRYRCDIIGYRYGYRYAFIDRYRYRYICIDRYRYFGLILKL